MKNVKLLLMAIVLIASNTLFAQGVSINTDGTSADTSAILDVKSTNQGFLPPRMTKAQRDSISSPVAGLLIFQTDGTSGYYYYTGTGWIGLLSNGAGGNSTSALIDCDGNIYHTIAIGDQLWMAENLRVTHYRNGDSIPNETDDGTWAGLSTGAYCWYDNDQSANEKYGTLYNWYAVNDSRGLCPKDWHVPTNVEWIILKQYLGGTDVAGGKMKATSNLWASPNTDATNSSSFSGLPGGYRNYNGPFENIHQNGYWWSSTEMSSTNARNFRLYYDHSYFRFGGPSKRFGHSVRCLRD